MNKYQHDSEMAALQRAAHQAQAEENAALDSFLAGSISEADYMQAMEATERAVEYAVSKGVSYKDLPAV